MSETRTTCCYCGTGCGVIIEHDHQRILGVRGDPDHPANAGRLCTKGSTLHLTALPEHLGLRLQTPSLRLEKHAPRQAIDWDGALAHAATRFADIIRRHGPDAVAFYISGQLLTEDYYVFNKLAKGLIGTNNIDSNSRLCMSSAVSGYKLTLGADSVPCSYEDIDRTDCLFISGSNTAYAHPIVFRRIEDARAANPDMKLIVVDPRRTDTAEAADLHLPLLPGTDIALYHAMLHVMLWEGLVDTAFIAAHTEGFETLREAVRDITPAAVASHCGLKAEDIVTAARWFGAAGRATLSLWCQGLNQSSQGSHNNAALIQLHLATGKIGKPGSGPFSLTGQPNAMGGREVGGMATLLSAHRDLANPEDRAEIAAHWGIESVPEKPGLTAVELFDAVAAGTIKGLWIACANPAQSMPHLGRVREALANCEFVVLQEAYADTETAAYADLLLPAASWGEKDGTVTNSERRISRVRPAVPPPGQARPDWRIATDFALALGQTLGATAKAQRLFPYTTPEAIFNEHRATTLGRDLDIGGLDYALLATRGPQQWPFPTGATTGTARLYADGRFAHGNHRARFVFARPHNGAEPTDARYPFRLNTGRLRDQWHSMSRTGTVPRLFNHAPEPTLDMHPGDAARRNLAAGGLIRVRSRRGHFVARLRLTTNQRPGQVFMPMHWGGRFMTGDGVNGVTLPTIDPISGQPELKNAAVAIEPFTPGWQIVALFRAAPGQGAATHALRNRLHPWLAQCDHATLTLAGREDPVLLFQAWQAQPWPAAQLGAFDALLGLDANALSFEDARRGISKRARLDGALLTAVRLVGETQASDWLKELMIAGETPAALRRWLLAPLSQPPAGSRQRGRVVCNCFNVSEAEILSDRSDGLDLEAIQDRRHCGTACGSCLTELRRLAAPA